MTLVPGLQHVDLNEGRFSGPFDLSSADMAQISYGARVVVVVVADVSNFKGGDTKDGDTKIGWTFTPVDVGIVRDVELKEHLATMLYLEGLEPTLFSTTIERVEATAGVPAVGILTDVDELAEAPLRDETDVFVPAGSDGAGFAPRSKPAAGPSSTGPRTHVDSGVVGAGARDATLAAFLYGEGDN